MTERETDDLREADQLWDADEVRAKITEDGDKLTLDGYVALYDTPSNPLSSADLGRSPARSAFDKVRKGSKTFREVIAPGAFTRSLSTSPDIVLRRDHNEGGAPLARTRAGTMTLTEDTRGIRITANLPDNEWGRPVRDAVMRGDIGGLSFRMGKVTDGWSFDPTGGPIRTLKEVQLRREVSLVTAPAYDTPATIRQLAEDADVEPDELAAAFAILRDPEGKLTDDQHRLIQAAVATRVETPFIDPHVAQMRERLLALAG